VKLSIIIVNWNTSTLLEGCLTSIFANPPDDPYEVVVVDNASIDDSPLMVRRNFPQVHLIENSENVGFARANNQGILKTTGCYVLLLNPDTVILPEALQILLDFIKDRNNIGAVGPMILNPNLTLQSSCNPMPTLLREFWQLMHLDRILALSVYREEKWDTNVSHQVEVLQGNCLLIRREALSRMGLLDERYFMFTEEVDLCYRLLQKGWVIQWVPMARIIHYGGQSTDQVPREMFLELYRSKLNFFQKTKGVGGRLIYKLILCVLALSRLLYFGIKPGNSQEKIQSYFALLRSVPWL
jgi:GT2 family glycosyltransferase